MFNITPKETFEEVVKVNVKTDSGWREESFTGVFKRVSEGRQRELLNLEFNEVIDEVLVGWKMVDLQRQPVEYNDVNVSVIKTIAGVPRAIVMAFLKANGGAKEKN